MHKIELFDLIKNLRKERKEKEVGLLHIVKYRFRGYGKYHAQLWLCSA